MMVLDPTDLTTH